MHGGQSYFLASLSHSPSPFLHSLQTFRSNMDAPSLTVARVRKKYDCFAVYVQFDYSTGEATIFRVVNIFVSEEENDGKSSFIDIVQAIHSLPLFFTTCITERSY